MMTSDPKKRGSAVNQNMMKQMQNRLMKMQEELAEETVEASAGGGVVKAVVTGQQKVVSIEIDPAAVDPDDVEMLQDMVVVAVNDALTKAQELAAQRLSSLTGGMKIPGLF
jgi:DNA-binding YbaB/EbfC family protein